MIHWWTFPTHRVLACVLKYGKLMIFVEKHNYQYFSFVLYCYQV